MTLKFILEICPCHVFHATFWDLSLQLLINSIRDLKWPFLCLDSTIKVILIRIPNIKPKQSSLPENILPHLIHSESFPWKKNRNRVVPVAFECVTICDICDKNVTKSVPKKNAYRVTKVTNSKLWRFVTVTNLQMITHWVWLIQILFLFEPRKKEKKATIAHILGLRSNQTYELQ